MTGTSRTLAGYTASVEIDATNETSPWNDRVSRTIAAALPMMGSVLALGTLTEGMWRVEISGLFPQVSSGPVVDSSGRVLEVRLTVSTVTIAITDTATGRSETPINLPTSVVFRRKYAPDVSTLPSSGSTTGRVVARWRPGEMIAVETSALAWDPTGALRAIGIDPDRVRRAAGDAVQAILLADEFPLTAPIRFNRSEPRISIADFSSSPLALPLANVYSMDAKLVQTPTDPLAVALLFEHNTNLRHSRVSAAGAVRPDPALYTTRHLRGPDTFIANVDPDILLETMAEIIERLLSLGTGNVPGASAPANIQFNNPVPVTSRRYAAPFRLRTDLPDGFTRMRLTAPGAAPYNARARVIQGEIINARPGDAANGRLRLTLAIGDASDPGDHLTLLFGFRVHIDWAPVTMGGNFLWRADATVVESSYAHVSAFWWILEGIAILASAVSFGVAIGGAAVVTTIFLTIAFFLAILSVGLLDLLVSVTRDVTRLLNGIVTMIPGFAATLPVLGTNMIPQEILSFLGRPQFERTEIDDLVIRGRLPPPDEASHVQSRDIAASAGDAFDLDTARIVPGVTPESIPLGADLLWWNAGGTPTLQNGPSTGVVVLRADSLLAVRYEDLAPLTFLRNLWLDIGSIPRFDSPPPADTTGLPVRPLFLAVRTSEGRFAKCAVWRDMSNRLHVQFVTYRTLVPHLAVSQSRTATRGDEIERGWDPLVRADFVRYRAAWRFGFRASWARLDAPVTLTWFVNGREVRGRTSVLLPSTAWISADVADGVLTVATPTGEPASIEVRAVARDRLGLTLERTLVVETDGTVTEYGESDIAWAERQLRALTPLEAATYRVPLDLGDPAAAARVTRPLEATLSDAVHAAMGFTVEDARAFVGLGPIDDGRS